MTKEKLVAVTEDSGAQKLLGGHAGQEWSKSSSREERKASEKTAKVPPRIYASL